LLLLQHQKKFLLILLLLKNLLKKNTLKKLNLTALSFLGLLMQWMDRLFHKDLKGKLFRGDLFRFHFKISSLLIKFIGQSLLTNGK